MMSNVARKRSYTTYEVGTVRAVEDGAITVLTPDGELDAERAASCLVPAAVGDEVAVLLAGDGRAFVLAVLVRAGSGAVDLAVKGDLRISAEGGTCRIQGTEGVAIASEGTVSLASRLLSLRAAEGNLVVSALTVLASSVLAHTDRAHMAAKALDWVCDRVSSTVRRSYRKVEELDQVRAARIDYRTEQEMCLRSENFLVGARKLAKLDAEQIHIG
ncbi:MAG: DUF3540 domain-containing protein [Polyangiaceae bacterium]|jgi:hypothetical protein